MVTEEVVSSGIIVERELNSKVRWIARVTATIIAMNATRELHLMNNTQGERVYWVGHDKVVDAAKHMCNEAWAEELDRDQVWIIT